SDPSAIVLAPDGVVGSLVQLVERLQRENIHVDVVDEVGVAAQIASRTPYAPPAVLVDLRGLVEASEHDDIQGAAERLHRVVHAMPLVRPIAVTGRADPRIVVACIRAGAADVLDMNLEGTAAARTVVTRVYQNQIVAASHAQTAATLRAMIEDMLKDLIRTERRSIDLEEKLAQFESVTGEVREVGDQRPPAILLVEPTVEIANQLVDRLERVGVATFAFTSGEDTTREVDQLLATGAGIDLALIAAQLPGIDGLEAVRRLRDRLPGLPAFLMTSVHDADLAARAADLGVVGFVQKPLPDLDEVVVRLAQLAHDALERTREQLYLQRIKARHERVLARYRSLPREP
ncbi:MAG TPA: response regulator, partial [Kofleriaceae bacterium]|nr:response regulator [Kofleriaceae bacterium]